MTLDGLLAALPAVMCLWGRRHKQCLGVSVKMPACVFKMPMGGIVCVCVFGIFFPFFFVAV